jgi:hypothetical protein
MGKGGDEPDRSGQRVSDKAICDQLRRVRVRFKPFEAYFDETPDLRLTREALDAVHRRHAPSERDLYEEVSVAFSRLLIPRIARHLGASNADIDGVDRVRRRFEALPFDSRRKQVFYALCAIEQCRAPGRAPLHAFWISVVLARPRSVVDTNKSRALETILQGTGFEGAHRNWHDLFLFVPPLTRPLRGAARELLDSLAGSEPAPAFALVSSQKEVLELRRSKKIEGDGAKRAWEGFWKALDASGVRPFDVEAIIRENFRESNLDPSVVVHEMWRELRIDGYVPRHLSPADSWGRLLIGAKRPPKQVVDGAWRRCVGGRSGPVDGALDRLVEATQRADQAHRDLEAAEDAARKAVAVCSPEILAAIQGFDRALDGALVPEIEDEPSQA